MRIVCDLLSTIMPPLLTPSENGCRFEHPPLLHFLNPVVYAGPTRVNREEAKDNA